MALQNLIDGITKTINDLQADRARLQARLAEQNTAQQGSAIYKRYAFKKHQVDCPLGPDHVNCGFSNVDPVTNVRTQAADHTQVDWSSDGAREVLREAYSEVQKIQSLGATITW